MNRIYKLIAVTTVFTCAQGCELTGVVLAIEAAHTLGKITANSSNKTGSESLTNTENLAAPLASIKPGDCVDVSGIYLSEITETGSRTVFLKKDRQMKIALRQDDNQIFGIDSSKRFEIEGICKGSTIKFSIFRGNQIDGVWEVNADATKLQGKWHTDGGGGASGKWNLVRAE